MVNKSSAPLLLGFITDILPQLACHNNQSFLTHLPIEPKSIQLRQGQLTNLAPMLLAVSNSLKSPEKS